MKSPLLILGCLSLASMACADRPAAIPLVEDPPPLVTKQEEPPNTEEVQPPPAPRPPPSVDTLGRLIPGANVPWGFALPRGATLEQKSPAMIGYHLRATRQALLEFYTHRRYHVVRRASGYQVLHSGDTLQDQDQTLGGARLVIHPQARHVFSLRIFPPNPVGKTADAALPAQATAPSPHRRASASPGTTPRTETPRAPRRPLRQKETFNPNHKKHEGILRTGPLVDQWKSQRPGHTFYD